jgi:hypothetical protein
MSDFEVFVGDVLHKILSLTGLVAVSVHHRSSPKRRLNLRLLLRLFFVEWSFIVQYYLHTTRFVTFWHFICCTSITRFFGAFASAVVLFKKSGCSQQTMNVSHLTIIKSTFCDIR